VDYDRLLDLIRGPRAYPLALIREQNWPYIVDNSGFSDVNSCTAAIIGKKRHIMKRQIAVEDFWPRNRG
jgi:hypothetical protein